jgi:adenylylsulfate kinase
MSILWIHGNTGAGKTHLAKEIQKEYGGIRLDGDDLRHVWTDVGFSKEDRIINNLRFCKLAEILDRQGFDVIVSTICPYRVLRLMISEMIRCEFIELLGGKKSSIESPYEPEA